MGNAGWHSGNNCSQYLSSQIQNGNRMIRMKTNHFSNKMKPVLLVLLFLLAAAFSAGAQSVSLYLLELESHTKWEAVDTKWNSARSQWVSNCKIENTPEKTAQLLLQFESNVKWEAVDADWAARRNVWVNECNNAHATGQVVKLLLEFESNIKWSAVDENWKTRRQGWINELNAIPQETASDKPGNNQVESALKSITIGKQTWMAENLHVDKFRNGDPIRQVKTKEEWETAKMNHEPAWWYGTNSVNDYGMTYGKLYNWYAVNDPRGLAPEGWHIPSDAEWAELLTFFMQNKVPFSKLKSEEGWLNHMNGTNEFGFSALPGGNSAEYISYNVGQEASWWTATQDGDEFAMIYFLKENNAFQPDVNFKYSGNSVRCVKNK